MNHLDKLENRSVHILREAYANFRNLCMLWSIGKDSTVLLWLARKAFFGHVPFPLVHIDTHYKIPEMTEYRDRLALEWKLDMIYGENREALDKKQTYPDGNASRIECCKKLKTEALVNTTIGRSMSWLNDVGIDITRKRSHYWNFNPDTYICPICALVYSCVPLGFSIFGSEAIFINNNESIHELIAVKNIFEQGGEKYTTLNQPYYEVLYTFIDDATQQQTREIQNIQIIRRIPYGSDSWKYAFNTLSKPLLEILHACRYNFKHLLKWSFKDKDTYINVYQEVADNFLSGKNQYALVHTILQKVFTENLKAPYVKDILAIQRRRMRRFYSEEGGSAAMYISQKEFETAYNEGKKIREQYAGTITEVKDRNTKVNESFRSFVYPLLLSLKTKDKAKFNDTMFRFYVGRSESIPKILIDMQQSDEKFQMLGYTFVAGLYGESLDLKKNAENTINEEVK